jgi:hypothetical protein
LLASPRRYSSGWTLASWTICLQSSLFFIFPDFHSFHPFEVGYLVPEQFSFYGVRWLASRPTPNLDDQVIPLRLAPIPWSVRHGCPTSSYATAGIALRVSGTLRPHHHDKVETPTVGTNDILGTHKVAGLEVNQDRHVSPQDGETIW